MARRTFAVTSHILGITLGAWMISSVALPAIAQDATAGAHEKARAAVMESPERIEKEIIGNSSEEISIAMPQDVAIGMETARGEEEENIGFPQLKPGSYPSQVFWLFISFGLLYVLMSRLSLPRVAEVIDIRNGQRQGNLDKAAELQKEAQDLSAAYQNALSTAQGAAQDTVNAVQQEIAEKLAAEHARFGEHARKRIATAEQSIAKAKNEAMASMADIASEIATEIVEKIASVQITKADAKKAVSGVMKGDA